MLERAAPSAGRVKLPRSGILPTTPARFSALFRARFIIGEMNSRAVTQTHHHWWYRIVGCMPTSSTAHSFVFGRTRQAGAASVIMHSMSPTIKISPNYSQASRPANESIGRSFEPDGQEPGCESMGAAGDYHVVLQSGFSLCPPVSITVHSSWRNAQFYLNIVAAITSHRPFQAAPRAPAPHQSQHDSGKAIQLELGVIPRYHRARA